MPQGWIGPISHAFQYVTVRALRSEGISADDLPDDRARFLIQMSSNWINWLTQQWFLPMRVAASVDARHSSIVHLPTQVPILDLYSLNIFKEGMFDMPLPSTAYNVGPRYVRMLYKHGWLPEEPWFVKMDGVFGWLEDDYRKRSTTLTAPVNEGDIMISLSDVTGFHTGDAVMVGTDPLNTFSFVVESVRGNQISCEGATASVPVGQTVTRYGKVPQLIQWATMLLVKDKRMPIGLQGTEDDESSPRWFAERLQSESVEGYSYSLAALPRMYGHGGGAWTTGNPEVDDCLSQFVCPNLYIGSVT